MCKLYKDYVIPHVLLAEDQLWMTVNLAILMQFYIEQIILVYAKLVTTILMYIYSIFNLAYNQLMRTKMWQKKKLKWLKLMLGWSKIIKFKRKLLEWK